MLERKVDGEKEPWRGLRDKLVELCDRHKMRKQMAWLKELAKLHGLRPERVIAVWELKGLPDVTTADGKAVIEKAVENISSGGGSPS